MDKKLFDFKVIYFLCITEEMQTLIFTFFYQLQDIHSLIFSIFYQITSHLKGGVE